METSSQNKIRVLAELKELLREGSLKREEILEVLGEGRRIPVITLQNVFYLVGGFIIILGVGILVAQVWDQWTQLMKVIFALGLSAFFYGIGYYFLYYSKRLIVFSQVAFLLFAFLLPLGLGTFFDLINISAKGDFGQVLIFSLLFAVYFASYWLFPDKIREIFFILSVAAASGLFIALTNLLFLVRGQAFEQYRVLILGLSYFLIAYYTRQKRFIVNLLYFTGSFMVLATGLALSTDNAFWLFFYPLLLIASFYLSIRLQSRIILFLATIFTFLEIIRLTSEYFSDSFGWPFALIVAGIGIMVIGYLSLELSKRFLAKSKNLRIRDSL